MENFIFIIFLSGYACIAAEHFIHVNKTATALLTGVACWTIFAVASPAGSDVSGLLLAHVSTFSGILFFLMGAMVIVELIDMHRGFEVITGRISTRNKRALLWIIGLLAFFLSAVLDNLTTAIVMISLIVKLLADRQDRLLFISIVVIAANAGGAWTPIGDVTTTMLWIGGRITTGAIMTGLFLPSVLCLVVPLVIATFWLHGATAPPAAAAAGDTPTSPFEKYLVFFLGLGALMFVPVFKTITHLPPFMGMLFGLSILWIVTEMLHRGKEQELRESYSLAAALRRIDMTSVLFFLGILICISSLETTGILARCAAWLDARAGNANLVAFSLGLLSAIVDNVPLTAAAMGMYHHPTDHFFWLLLSFCVGTGGSVLIIGSAAGVAAMGLARIDFFWYLKKITPLALAGYLAGAGTFVTLEVLINK